MSYVTRYRVPISGTFPISGHTGTDIVNHIPDIGINIGINIGCPDIGDMLSRYRCQYRVPISGVPISGYDSHRCRSQYRTRYRITECAPVIAPHSLHIVPDRRSSQSPVAFRGGDPPIPVLQECANLCVSWSLEGLAPLDPRAVLSIRSASDVLVRTKDSQASFVGRLRRLFVQDLPILVTTHSRVLFLEFHANDEVPVQSRPIKLGLQLADLI